MKKVEIAKWERGVEEDCPKLSVGELSKWELSDRIYPKTMTIGKEYLLCDDGNRGGKEGRMI